MSAREVRVTLTEAEAKNLRWAAGNVLDYPDAAESIFPHPSARAAAYRAFAKLEAAIWPSGLA